MGVLLPPLIFLAIFGPELIQFIYPADYANAGWMLQVLAAGLIVFVGSLIGPFYLAYGNSLLFMKLQATRSVLLMLCMAIGGQIAGASGAICGVAATRLVFYPIQITVYRNYDLWLPKLDVLGLMGPATIIGAGLWLKAMFLSPDIGLELRVHVIEIAQNFLSIFGN
ncbi:MAG: hypothetical protein F6K09_24750 [Merismopedia sp. SIO2A8]|nr:hypothetical protein [Merismopedia sp. SIO2A8]